MPDRVDAREPACADPGQRVVPERAPCLAPERVPAVGDVAAARILAAADEHRQRARDVLARHELRDQHRRDDDGHAEQQQPAAAGAVAEGEGEQGEQAGDEADDRAARAGADERDAEDGMSASAAARRQAAGATSRTKIASRSPVAAPRASAIGPAWA